MDYVKWITEFYDAALRANDWQRIELVYLWQQVNRLDQLAPQTALGLAKRGYELAVQLGEMCWVLIFGFERCATLNYFVGDQVEAIKQATHLAVTAQRPESLECPMQTMIYRILIETYLYGDPVGYASKIRDNISFMETNFTLDEDSYRNVEWQRSALALALGDVAEAQAAALRSLARSTDDYQRAGAYTLLCEAAWQAADYPLLHEYAQEGDLAARRSERKGRLIEFLCWEALANHQLGNLKAAAEHFAEARQRARRYSAKPEYFYWDARCAYHEMVGDLDEALEQRRLELTAVERKNYFEEVRCRTERVRLLKAQQLPYAEELASARLVAQKLREPQQFLARLDKLE